MSQLISPKCPYCGFGVLTNRYPMCERCERPLPNDMVLSPTELEDVFARERQARQEAMEKAYRKEMATRPVGLGTEPPSALDLLSWGDLFS
jgi:predicted amidophosphoribosyltransferase